MKNGSIPAVYEKTNVKLTLRERIEYSIAEYGYNSIYIWVTSWMMIYYTDTIGVAAAAVSLLTLAVRIFDGVNDPIIGSLADRTNTRFGRYKPWVACGAVALGILMILLFSAKPTWSDGRKLVWMWVLYILVTVASTCCNMPYGALNGVMTSDSHERGKIGSIRMLFACVGTYAPAIYAIPVIVAISGFSGGPEAAPGYFWAVTISVIIGVPLLVFSAVKTKEVIKPSPTQAKIPLKKQFAAFFKNKYAIILALGYFSVGFGLYGRMGMLTYYFTYVANNAALMTTGGIICIFTSIIGPGFVNDWVYNRFHHKGRTMMVNGFLGGATAIPMFWLLPDNPLFWVSYFLSQTFTMASLATAYGTVGDTVDVGEYRTGVRVDGFIASFISLWMKIGGAVGPALLLKVMDIQGYVPNQVQNTAVLNTMSFSISLCPAILGTMILILFAFYDMDEKKHEGIREAIEQRHMKEYAAANGKGQSE